VTYTTTTTGTVNPLWKCIQGVQYGYHRRAEIWSATSTVTRTQLPECVWVICHRFVVRRASERMNRSLGNLGVRSVGDTRFTDLNYTDSGAVLPTDRSTVTHALEKFDGHVARWSTRLPRLGDLSEVTELWMWRSPPLSINVGKTLFS